MTPRLSGGLGRATAVGVVWLLAQTAGTRLVGFVAQLVIASILHPDDFGLIGLAFTIANLGTALISFGIDQIILQRHRTLKFWMVPAFYLSLALGAAGCLILLAAAPICAAVYGVPGIEGLVDVISVGLPLGALGTVPTILLRARFEFRTVAAINFAEALATQGLTIMLALRGFGPYSFAIPLPIAAALRSGALWAVARPDLSGTWRKVLRARFLVGSGIALFFNNVMQTVVANGDYIILGLVGTTTSVGNYFFAFKLASQPLLLLAANLSSALFPALSHLRSEPRAQSEAAFKAARLMTLVIMPLAMLQAAVIAPVTHILFGVKWDQAIPLMQLLSVPLGFDAVAWVAGALLNAQRGFWKQLTYQMMFTPAFFACAGAGGAWGSAIGVATGVAAYYALVTPLYSYLIFGPNGISARWLFSIYLTPAALGAGAIGGGLATYRLAGLANDFADVAITGGSGLLYYAVLLRLLDPSGLRDLQDLGRRVFRPARQPRSWCCSPEPHSP